MTVCKSVGLNPLTKPFEYILLNGKLTLYALRACTDQLRAIHGVSVEEMTESERDGVFVVTAKVKDKAGRTDISKGAVSIGNLKGDALCNALMKCETKAKRRATLSVCGLGFLDESEIETIPDSAKAGSRDATPKREPPKAAASVEPHAIQSRSPSARPSLAGTGIPCGIAARPPADPKTGAPLPPSHIPAGEKPNWTAWGTTLAAALKAGPPEQATAWMEKNQASLDACKEKAPKIHRRLLEIATKRTADTNSKEAA